jgi:hypothetical protein
VLECAPQPSLPHGSQLRYVNATERNRCSFVALFESAYANFDQSNMVRNPGADAPISSGEDVANPSAGVPAQMCRVPAQMWRLDRASTSAVLVVGEAGWSR